MISACEWIFGGRPLDAILRLLRASGYDGIELMGEPDRRDADRLGADVRAAGLTVSGTTAICNWPTEDRDLANPDAGVRRRAVEYFKGCVDLAAAVGAPVVGLIPAAVGRLDALTSYDREWRWAVEGAREIALHAGENGVAVGVEAINRYETFLVNRLDQALEFIAEIDVAGTGVIADAFHMQLEERDSGEAVERAGARLVALHIADSNRLGLGHGQLALAPVLEAARKIGFDGPFVMEFTAPGPNPFKADKGADRMRYLDDYVTESADALRRHDGDN